MPAPRHDRATELTEIEQFLAQTGATPCRPAYAWGVGAALPIAEEARRIAMFTAPTDVWSFWMQRAAKAPR
jgi:hypothetical protein